MEKDLKTKTEKKTLNYFPFFCRLKQIMFVLLIGSIFFMIFRLIFIYRFGNFSALFDNPQDLRRLLFNGFRFDLQIVAYTMIPIIVLSIFSLFISTEKIVKTITKSIIYYTSILFTLLTFVLIADQQYYSNFKFHFNSVLFDFFDERPLLLLKSVWQEHPVILVFAVSIIIFLIFSKLLKKVFVKIEQNRIHLNPALKIIILLVFFGLYGLSLRGSIGTFPLQMEDTNISSNEFINACVPNGIITLKWATEERKPNFVSKDSSEIYRKNGFNSIEEAISEYYSLPIDSVKNHDINDFLFAKSTNKPTDKSYNLVFIIVESWSNKLIDYHSDNLNLLASMQHHLKEDLLFRNFQSSTDGTLHNLEGILLNTTFHPLSDTKYRFLSFPTSIALPFYNAGYETMFVTGLELSWRRLNEILPNQYFTKIKGKYDILNELPTAKSNKTWGIYDHYLTEYILETLNQGDKPKFILSLTCTNHTPFELPTDYELPDLKLDAEEEKMFAVENKILKNYLTAYQYTNIALGDFLDKLKKSKHANNTIVVITGDHNVRTIISYPDNEAYRFKNSVPLYIYLPPEIRSNLHVDLSRYGAHSDIMPSLYPLILNNTTYFNLGQNLFDASQSSNKYISINDGSVLYSNETLSETVNRKVAAYKTISEYYFSQYLKNQTINIGQK